jgi:hypothetical protein
LNEKNRESIIFDFYVWATQTGLQGAGGITPKKSSTHDPIWAERGNEAQATALHEMVKSNVELNQAW